MVRPGSGALEDFVGKLKKPRTAWVMLRPADHRGDHRCAVELSQPGDVIIDGGNTFWSGRRPPWQGAEGTQA